jgi:hypothetical protein
MGYAAEASFDHSESTEDFVMHRGNADFGWKGTTTSVDVGGSLVLIGGSSLGPTWSGAEGAPAAGGSPVRDWRDALAYRSSVQLKQSWGAWFARPAFTFYDHDFQTIHKSTPGYQNYVDRSEFTVSAADSGNKSIGTAPAKRRGRPPGSGLKRGGMSAEGRARIAAAAKARWARVRAEKAKAQKKGD